MNTDDLIDRLAHDLAPVRPLRSPRRRAALWTLAAVGYVAVLTFGMFDPLTVIGGVGPRLLLPQMLALLTGVAAATAAFSSVVPGRGRDAPVWAGLAAVAWAASLLLPSSAGLGAAPHREWLCVVQIVLGGVPLLALLAVMLRRGAPLNAALTGALAALAVGALANVGACYSQPHVDNVATLVWHGGAIVALMLLGYVGGRFVFSWDAVRGSPPANM